MPISTTCACGYQISAKDEDAGKRARCRQCGEVFLIPRLVDTAPAALKAYVIRTRPLEQPLLYEMGLSAARCHFYWLDKECPDELDGVIQGHIVGQTVDQQLAVGILYASSKQQEKRLLDWLEADFLPEHHFREPPYSESPPGAIMAEDRFRLELAVVGDERIKGSRKKSGAASTEDTAKFYVWCTCGKKILVLAELAGKHIRCPQCMIRLQVPRPCPACGQAVDPDKRKCPRCTFDLSVKPPGAVADDADIEPADDGGVYSFSDDS